MTDIVRICTLFLLEKIGEKFAMIIKSGGGIDGLSTLRRKLSVVELASL